MELRVDARGLACPKPVIKTKKALEDLKEGSVLAIVDNEVAKENIVKLANKLQFHCSIKESNEEFEISIFKGELNNNIEEMLLESNTTQDLVIVVGSDKLGDGEDQLGEILMKGYFYSLSESKPVPKAIVFLNSGVRLAVEGSSIISSLKSLIESGCEILVCGTCLDYYNLKELLEIGTISNMYTIVELMNEAKNTIKL